MKISPSILTANFINLKEEIDSVSNADYIHLDIMDGFFVPNISFGPYISKCVASYSKALLDIHLMVKDPLFWIEKFHFETTHFITIHIESDSFLATFKKIKELGIKAGISIKPKTDITVLSEYLNEVDLILVMTVEPGFGGQSFMEDAAMKVRELALLREKNGYQYMIEVDGGINNETIKIVNEYGCDIAVVGNYLFSQKDRKEEIKKLQKCE